MDPQLIVSINLKLFGGQLSTYEDSSTTKDTQIWFLLFFTNLIFVNWTPLQDSPILDLIEPIFKRDDASKKYIL